MKNKFLISIVWLFLLAPWLYAAGKKAIGIDFFKEVKMISNVQVYQDNIYFIVKQADMEEKPLSQRPLSLNGWTTHGIDCLT